MRIVRYRKLPVEVDTVQWIGTNLDELIAFTGGLFVPVDPGESLASEYTGKVFDALHSTWVLVKTGQTVVCGVLGEFYPIAEDVLAETYERVTDPADFFQPGHSYSHRNGWNDFHCVAVTAHPTTGQRLAMGWISDRGEWHRPTVCNLGQWLHEYDGVQPPTTTEDGQ
jgi:hypothetical protein